MTFVLSVVFALPLGEANIVTELLAEIQGAESVVDTVEERRLIGPPSTWLNEWTDNQDPRCPRWQPGRAQQCDRGIVGVECYYQKQCCPWSAILQNGRCVAGKKVTCQRMLPNPLWTVEDYGQLYCTSDSKCRLGGVAPSNARRLIPEASVREDEAEDQRRLIGPSWTWPVLPWTWNNYRCPEREPRNGGHCHQGESGVTCNYQRACCPRGGQCVAAKQATCGSIPGPNRFNGRWTVSDYGQTYTKNGQCSIVHAGQTPPPPAVHDIPCSQLPDNHQGGLYGGR